MQKNGGKNHPVMYASRKLLPRKQRYSTGEKECIIIVIIVIIRLCSELNIFYPPECLS